MMHPDDDLYEQGWEAGYKVGLEDGVPPPRHSTGEIVRIVAPLVFFLLALNELEGKKR